MRNHSSLALMAVVALALIAAQPALGAGPTREPLSSEALAFPARLVCDFPVLIEAVRSNATIKTFANGRLIISGSFWSRVTNTRPGGGPSISFNNSGPLTLAPNADGSLDFMIRGQSLLYFFAEDLGGRRLLRMTGLVRETLSSDNVVTEFSHTGGTTENLCETLK
jgi:hypothetical protein